MGKDNKKVRLLILIHLGIRLIFPFIFYVFNPNYSFKNSFLPYFIYADSWYYGIKSGVMWGYIYSIFVSLIMIVLFYYLLRWMKTKSNTALYGSIFLSLFPNFYNQTFIGYIDTPHIILLMFTLMIPITYLLLNVKNTKGINWFKILVVFIYIGLFRKVWTGADYAIIIWVLSIILSSFRRWWHYLMGGIIGLIGIIWKYDSIKSLFYHRSLGIAEYTTPLYFVYYVIFALIVYMFFISKKDLINRWLFSIVLILFSFSLFFQRVCSFMLIFGIFFIFKNYKKSENIKVLLISLFLLNLIVLGVETYSIRPLINRPYNDLIEQINPHTPVLTKWDNGYIIRYFGRNDTFFASPVDSEPEYSKGISYNEIDGIKYLDEFKKDYYLIVSTRDMRILKYYDNNSILGKSLNNQTLIYFNLIDKKIYKDEKYWLYKRK